MDERIMKVLEAAGARIADLEADLAEMKDANDFVCAQRDETENKLAEKEEEIKEKEESIRFWFSECNRREVEIAALKAERAGVEAVAQSQGTPLQNG